MHRADKRCRPPRIFTSYSGYQEELARTTFERRTGSWSGSTTLMRTPVTALARNYSNRSNEHMRSCRILRRGVSTIRVFAPLLEEVPAGHAQGLVEEPKRKPQPLL